jgi:uncharacterized protein (DUF58 family)
MTPADLGRLDGLALRVRRGMGERPGDRRFPGRPQPAGIEIEAHARYVPGDDLRHIDWNALGRLDTLLVRRFTAEREVLVHLLVDCSASMGVPARDRKLAVATDVALALAYLALATTDAVRVALLDGVTPVSPVFRGRGSLLRIRDLLAAAAVRGTVDVAEAVAEHARRYPRPGLVVLISDLMTEPAGIERGLAALRARRHEVVAVHVVARGELEPEREFTRGLLRDVETGETHPVVLTPETHARYRELLDVHLVTLATTAARVGAVYARLATDRAVREFVALDLARAGVVGRR